MECRPQPCFARHIAPPLPDPSFAEGSASWPPSLAALCAGSSLERLPDGRLGTLLYRLSRPGAGRTWLKIAALVSHEELAGERDRLAWLQGRLPVPEVLHYAEHEGHAFLLLSEVQGLPAHQALLEQEPLRRVELFAQGLKRLHGVSAQGCPFSVTVGRDLLHAERLLRAGCLKREEFLEAAGKTPEELLAELTASAEEAVAPVFTHGDFCLPNVLLSAEGVTGFVDWGLAGVADRHRDLALAADSVRFNLGEAYVDSFLQSYGLEHVDPARIRYHFLLDLFFTHVDTRSPRPSAREDG